MTDQVDEIREGIETLLPPFPWFGGKRRVASEVWRRLGDVPNYVEPFAGGLAVLLGRPHSPRIETINDADAFVVNFWRAASKEPDQVAAFCDWPVGEVDLLARHRWLSTVGAEHLERLKHEPEYFDAKIAGWWVWGQCAWIGTGWCVAPNVSRKRPQLNSAGNGIHAALPKMGGFGDGVHRGAGGFGFDSAEVRTEWLLTVFRKLQGRMRHVRTTCGDWRRVVTPSVTWRNGVTATFLDPPYSHSERQSNIYRVETDCATGVREWAIANGEDPKLRIALCGYDTEHGASMPESWSVFHWKAQGGMGNQGTGRGKANRERECVWFSPGCL